MNADSPQSASHVTKADPATNSSARVAGEETSNLVVVVVVVVLVRIWRQRLRWAARGASKALLWQRKRDGGDGLATCDQPAGVDAGPSQNTTVGLQQKGSGPSTHHILSGKSVLFVSNYRESPFGPSALKPDKQTSQLLKPRRFSPSVVCLVGCYSSHGLLQ
jgi:hypothetical protein